MKIAECSHIRIRDGNDYNMDVERTIKHFEARFNLDFRSLPNWEKLVHRMHLAITDAKQKIQDSKHRKALIINKLYNERVRRSPFELTEELVRTRKLWNKIEDNLKTNKKSIMYQDGVETGTSLRKSFESSTLEGMSGEEKESIGHPNTENVSVPVAALDSLTSLIASTHLPNYTCVNQHKLLSSLSTATSLLDRPVSTRVFEMEHKSKPKEWLLLNQSTKVISCPNKIVIENSSLDEQILRFSILNCTTEYLNLRYMTVTDKTPFHRAKVLPSKPLKIYPGLTVTFEFIFRFIQNEEDFSSEIYFKVGKKVYSEAPLEAFCLPIVSNFKFGIKPDIRMPDIVNIPSRYLWHINAKCGPIGTVSIAVDNGSYDLSINKLPVNLAIGSEISLVSISPISPTTESVLEREEDEEVINQTKGLLPLLDDEEVISIKSEDIVMIFIDEWIERALDIFVFEETFLHLEPLSKQTIAVRQTKAAHIGFHQDVFEFKFRNPITGNIAFSKNVKVFGEVLPNPVQVQPIILDMTSSVQLGYCEGHFTITNNHKIFSVNIKIKLTTKIKQLIHIYPMEVTLTSYTSCKFFVRLCSKDLADPSMKREDFVHFTIKIVVDGHYSVYNNVPPIFYEIIAPCSVEFKKIYSKKFFNDALTDI